MRHEPTAKKQLCTALTCATPALSLIPLMSAHLLEASKARHLAVRYLRRWAGAPQVQHEYGETGDLGLVAQ